MIHPDDVAAVVDWLLEPLPLSGGLDNHAERLLIALAESRAKRLPADQAELLRKLRGAAVYYESSFDGLFGLAADLLEAQAAAIEAMRRRAEKARAEGYAAGQRAMRERAAGVINHNPDASGSRYIEALPIIEEPKEKVHHSPAGRTNDMPT